MANSRPKKKFSSIETNVCYLCGYVGRTRALSIKNDAFAFLRHVSPAPGASTVRESSTHVHACHLCALILEEQKKVNRSTTNFFFKGFFRSNGACNQLKTTNDDDEEQRSPPPLRKSIEEISSSSLDASLKPIRSAFLSSYQSILSSSTLVVDSCQLCFALKPRGTLYRLSQSQFPFFSRRELDLCTLCYYNLLDQHKLQAKEYRRPRAECYLCHRHIDFVQWEMKLFETESLPFLLTLHDETYRRNHLYDEQRLALACDQCFFGILFQYLDQDRREIPPEQRIYSWQAFYSRENEEKRLHELNDELFYSSKAKQLPID